VIVKSNTLINYNVLDRHVRCICMCAASSSTIMKESKYFNHHESYYNEKTIKRCFDILSMYKRYVQAINIHYILVKRAVIHCLLPFQLLLYYYYCSFLSNFELHCHLKCLLLQYMIAFVLTFIFDIDFWWKASHFDLQARQHCASSFDNLLWVNWVLIQLMTENFVYNTEDIA